MPTTTIPPVQFRTVDGLRIRYAESDGPSETTVLLTSPWPENLYAFGEYASIVLDAIDAQEGQS